MTVTAFYPADVGREIVGLGGYGIITGYTDAQHVTVEIKAAFPATSFASGQWSIAGTQQTTCTPSAATPVGKAITLTLAASGWRTGDVGKFVELNGGLVRIDTLTSDTIANGTIISELASAVAAEPFAWILKGSAWGGIYGWPRCGTLYEQRHWLAGSPGFPQRVWGSTIGEFLDFTLGTLDDEAMAYDIASGELNPIRHLVDAKGLLALTTGAEFSIRGGQEKAITPTNLQVKQQSAFGCSSVPPVRVGSEWYFNQRAGRKVRALSPNEFDSEQYGAPDMSVLSEHVTESGLRALTYQQEPDSLIYAVRNDGVLATLTADRDQDVIAWARQVTQGIVESADVIPTADGDRVFVSVARVIDGRTVRYTEMLDPDLGTDCALTGHSDAGSTTWTGLDHLEGRTVNVKADGVVLQDRVVTGGSITIERAAFDIEIGLNYITTVKTLTPALNGPGGSAQGANLSIHDVIVRVRDTTGCRINYQEVAFVLLDDEILDKPPPVFSGDKSMGGLGWAQGVAQTVIQQDKPYPFHLLAVITKLSVNDG